MDSVIYGNDFGSQKVKNIFEEESIVESWIKFEVALAVAQGELGIIPKEAADEIKAKGSLKYIKVERVAEIYSQTMLSSVSLIRAFKEICENGAGEYIHFGATTQDVFDSTLAFRLKEVMDIFEGDLCTIRESLNELADRYRNTIMPGRTHGQQALPITFGFKAAYWSDAISKHIERFQEARKRILVGTVSGAVGNYSSFYLLAGDEEKCREMEKRVLDTFGLHVPDITIQPHLERLAEFMNLLLMLTVSFGKIADEIFLLQRNEFAEMEEPFDTEHQISSSTMPQKRNPNRCELIRALSLKIRSNAAAFSNIAMQQERDHAPFYLEDLVIPETCVLMSTMLEAAKFVLGKLVVKENKMAENVELTGGLLMTEAVMLALAKKTGRKETGFQIVHNVAMEAFEKGVNFKDHMGNYPEVNKYFTKEEIKSVLDPAQYLGLNDQLIDGIINKKS